MKKIVYFSALALAMVLTFGTGIHAQMGPCPKMMEKAGQQEAGPQSPQAPPCKMKGEGGMGMMGHGMGPGMGAGMGPCGCGMGPAMMGCGMHPAMLDQVPPEKMEKFLDETKELRKRIHDLKFDYNEAMRNPKATIEQRAQIEKEMFELQDKLEEKTKQ